MIHRRYRAIRTAGLAAVLAAGACGTLDPARIARSVERDLTAGAPEVARQRDAALAVWSAHYGNDRRPLDLSAAHASALHAARVYRDADDIRAELGVHVQVVPVITAITGLQYYVADEPDRQVVSIRGTRTAEIRNWVATAVVTGALDDVLGVDVHEGFLVAVRIIQVALVPQLDPARPVHLTGHSLGGALATLLALRLGHLGYDVSVTTFGAPKLTTFDAFAHESRLHDLDLVRLVNAGDVVQHFPSVMDLSGTRIYAQFGREWTLTADGGCAATNLAASLTRSATIVVDKNLPAWSLDAHGMGEYVDRLARLAALPEAEGRCS